MTLSRRTLVQGAATAGLASLVGTRVNAQSSEPIRIGLLTVKTGPLASGGLDMERGLLMYTPFKP